MAQAQMLLGLEQTYAQKLLQIAEEKTKCKIWTRNKYNDIVNLMTKEPSKEDKTPAYYYLLTKYEILQCGDIQKIIRKRSSSDDDIKYYACLEDMYNIVYKIHIATGHGGRDKMIKEANRKYANVSTEAVELFKELCEECQLKKRKIANEFSVISAVLSPDIESKEKALKDFELYIKRTETGVFKDEETQIAKVDHSKSQILCPHCSVLFKCQHCTSKDIQIASLEKEISYLRPRMRKQESLMCCQCCADKEKPAFYECKECDKYMCEQCNVKHNTDPALVDHRSKYIDPLKYKVKDTFQIRGIKIRDMKMLNDELLVVADGKENKLITCRIDGRDLMEIMLPMKPFRMAVTDENTVAVSFGSNMKVGLINVTSGESTKEFKLNSSCFAIAYNNMEIFVSCQEKTEDISDSEHTVHVINIHTGELHYKITLSNFTPENMLVGTDARMFFTYYGNKCICTDMTGRNIFDISAKNMIGPWGIAFDNNDGMLIVCNKSKNVHRISTDGGEKKVLFSFPAYIKTTRSSAYICHDNITGSIIIGRGYKFAVFTRT
ncbi:unnamed protein product [Mytilus edulis]|uniref:B box-type domain-containing protein n=1 Tax=Mytilus edulis TaxID=6550 RepID=A0A8S3QRH7_MYTED|nr:unnamed protein product [Mytilus edulis]